MSAYSAGRPSPVWTRSRSRLTAAGDDDEAAGATGSDAAVRGDGLSNFEEYRGFFIGGSYVRLNPRQKDVFIDLDQQFFVAAGPTSPMPFLLTLNPRLHFMEPTEVKGVDEPSRNLSRIQGVVNPNREGVPTAHSRPQRTVRMIYQETTPPLYHLGTQNVDVQIWQLPVLGATFSDDILDNQTINAPGNVGTIETPMRTQFSELYPRTFTNIAVSTDFSYPTHFDAVGNVVPQCTSTSGQPCDFWDTTLHLIYPMFQPGGWFYLYTVPDLVHNPSDHYTLRANLCGADVPVVGGLTAAQWNNAKAAIAAHEMGHAMKMDHLKNFDVECGDLMFDDESTGTARRAMSNYIPQPTRFSTNDHAMMRLWQP